MYSTIPYMYIKNPAGHKSLLHYMHMYWTYTCTSNKNIFMNTKVGVGIVKKTYDYFSQSSILSHISSLHKSSPALKM